VKALRYPPVLARERPPCASMIERQIDRPMPEAVGFGRVEGLKDALETAGSGARNRVPHRDEYAGGLGFSGADQQLPRPIAERLRAPTRAPSGTASSGRCSRPPSTRQAIALVAPTVTESIVGTHERGHFAVGPRRRWVRMASCNGSPLNVGRWSRWVADIG
jgi:hypothetical protein